MILKDFLEIFKTEFCNIKFDTETQSHTVSKKRALKVFGDSEIKKVDYTVIFADNFDDEKNPRSESMIAPAIVLTKNKRIGKKMPVLNTNDLPMDAEIEQFVEEAIEFLDAYDDENCIEEFYDVLQVMINILDRKGLLMKLNEGLEKHIKKIEKRGWDIKEFV